MINLLNLVFDSDLDFNFEMQTCGFLRVSAKKHHAPCRHSPVVDLRGQARICATHALSANAHVSTLCGRPSGRTQSQRLLVPGLILCDGLCPVDLPRVAARHRSQLACSGTSALSHGVSLPDDLAQHTGQRERHTPVANLRGLRPAPDWPGATTVCQGTVWTGAR